jgi:hypothetical protein
MHMKPAIAYIRVSTTKQGKSGLGLEAQEAALARFAESEGFAYLQTFSETESGKRDDDHRPQLSAALEAARKAGAPIRPSLKSTFTFKCPRKSASFAVAFRSGPAFPARS